MIDQLENFANENGCPKCGSASVTPVRYTWWGGMIGPKILHHTKCETCKYRYNSKTRKSNTPGIIIYTAITIILIVALTVFLR